MATINPFGLPPEDALDYFRRRSANPTETLGWREMMRAQHARAFTVAQSMHFNVLGDISAALEKSLREGGTFRQFQNELQPLLEKKGWWGRKKIRGRDGKIRRVQLGSKRRLKTIFRTNLAVSNAAGRWKRIEDQKDEFPYLMYDAVNDSKTRDQHREWDGLVLPVGDPFWDTHAPPNGWGCRCIVRQVSESQLKKRGLKVGTAPPVHKIGGVPKGIDEGWDYNPGRAQVTAAWQNTIATLEKGYEKYGDAGVDIARATLTQMRNGIEFQAFAGGRFLDNRTEPQAAWPVAMLRPERAKALGFDKLPRAVSLTHKKVVQPSHHQRWEKFTTQEWEILREVLDTGEFFQRSYDSKYLFALPIVGTGRHATRRVAIVTPGVRSLQLDTFFNSRGAWFENRRAEDGK